jgi:hypothetical protein
MATPDPLNKTPHGPYDPNNSGTCQGTVVTFQPQKTDANGTISNDGALVTYTVTNLTYSLSSQTSSSDELDVSHIGQAYGEPVLTQERPLIGSTGGGDSGKEVQIDFIGTKALDEDQKGELVIKGGIDLTTQAKVTSSSITLAVNDVIRGSVTFSVSSHATESGPHDGDCVTPTYD